MASRFTRGELRKILGDAHTEELENQLIALHLGVVDPLKDDLAAAKAEADKLPALQNELDALKSGKDWKSEYDTMKKSFDDYKAEVAGKEALAAKQAAYRKLLTAENIPAKFHDRIVKMTDFANMELDGDAIKDADKQRESIRTEWGEYKAAPETRGADVETPPTGGSVKLTRGDIYKKDEHGRYVMSTAERQKALAEMMNKQ